MVPSGAFFVWLDCMLMAVFCLSVYATAIQIIGKLICDIKLGKRQV